MSIAPAAPSRSEPQSKGRPFKVALVGRRLADNENLGLAYLVAALEGLTFPCLAGSQICQEEAVIIE